MTSIFNNFTFFFFFFFLGWCDHFIGRQEARVVSNIFISSTWQKIDVIVGPAMSLVSSSFQVSYPTKGYCLHPVFMNLIMQYLSSFPKWEFISLALASCASLTSQYSIWKLVSFISHVIGVVFFFFPFFTSCVKTVSN